MTVSGGVISVRPPVGFGAILRPHKPDSRVRWRVPTLRGRAYSNGTVEVPEGIP